MRRSIPGARRPALRLPRALAMIGRAMTCETLRTLLAGLLLPC